MNRYWEKCTMQSIPRLHYHLSNRIIPSRGTISSSLTEGLDLCRNIFTNAKIKTNNFKTETILLTRRRPPIKYEIKINNDKLQWKSGIQLDKRLHFISYVYSTCRELSSIYLIFNQKSNKAILYNIVILPKLLYAAPVCGALHRLPTYRTYKGYKIIACEYNTE